MSYFHIIQLIFESKGACYIQIFLHTQYYFASQLLVTASINSRFEKKLFAKPHLSRSFDTSKLDVEEETIKVSKQQTLTM